MPRRALFTPTGTRYGPYGPNLKPVRRTLCFDSLSRQTRLEYDWRTDGHRPLLEEWTGLSEFEERSDEPIAYFPQAREGVDHLGNKAKGLTIPTRKFTLF